MSEIPFFRALGDELVESIAAVQAAECARGWRSRLGRRRSSRLAVVLVGLVLAAGSAAAAHALLDSAQRLADGSVTCFFTTSGQRVSLATPGAGGQLSTGQSPIAVCRRWYQWNAHTGLKAADLRFVACKQHPTVVAVYVSDGRGGQCERLGEKPLPAAYPAAVASLRTLQLSLWALQKARYCVRPSTLASEVLLTLARLGFRGWSAVVRPGNQTPMAPAGTGGGPCGLLIGTPAALWNVAINGAAQSVDITRGPPYALTQQLNHIEYELVTGSYYHCYTASAIKAVARHWFAPTKMALRYATTATWRGSGYLPKSEVLYNDGCARLTTAFVANNLNYVDLWLMQKGAPTPPDEPVALPPSAFEPS